MTLPIFMLVLTPLVFFASVIACELLRPVLIKGGVADTATARSSHSGTVVRGFGVAIALAYALGVAVALCSGGNVLSAISVIAVIGALAGAVIGVFEDVRGLSVRVRSVLLLILGLVVSVSLTVAQGFTPLSILFVIYAVLFVSGYVNVANFMDGLNGISGLHGIVAGAGFAVMGWVAGTAWIFVCGLVLAAAFAGFLPMNLKGRGFMGDSGSYFLGAAVAVMSISMLATGFPLLCTIGSMVIYFGDVAVTLVKRVRQKKSFTEPHKEHTYQRIQQKGYSHLQASAMVFFASVLTTALGIVSFWVPDFIWQVMFFVLGLIVLVSYLKLPDILPSRAES